MGELVDDLADIVSLTPAMGAVLLALDRGVGGLAPESLRDPIEQVGNVVQKLAVREPPGLGNVARSADHIPPDGQDGVGLLVQVIRQQGGFAHGCGPLCLT